MKNLTLAICAAFFCCVATEAQSVRNPFINAYVPFHQSLLSSNPNTQYGSEGKSLADNEIAYRHDVWKESDWAINDSGSFAYDGQGWQTNKKTSNYSSAQSWNNNTNDNYTYDRGGNVLTHLTQNWNPAAGGWVNATNYLASYYTASKPLTQTYQIWVSDGWQNTYNYIYGYDANNNLESKIEQVWNGTSNAWVNAQRTLQTMRSNLLISQVVQSWNSGTDTWVNYYQMIYAYDGHGNQTNSIEQIWNSSVWVNSYKDSTVFDASNNATSLISQVWDTAQLNWVNKFMSNYTFDVNKNMTQFYQYNWDNINLVWTPVYFDTYTYNAANKILGEVETDWNQSTAAYVNAYKATYTYDAHNNVTEFQDYYWGNNGNWVPNDEYGYTIDGNNKTVYELDQVYDQSAGTMVNVDQYYFYYTIDAATGIATVQNDLGAVLYPNPTSGNNININLTLAENVDVTLNTYDEQGKLLNTEMRQGYGGANDMQISYPSLSPGIYFIQLVDRTNDRTSVLKFVKN